jgi:hypothetical protein
MKKLVLALSVLLLASSSASAWPYVVGYAPVATYPVPVTAYYGAPVTAYYGTPVTAYYGAPVTAYYGAPAVVSPGYYYGAPVVGYRAPYYAYGYPGYVPGQPVRNLLRAAW